MRDHHFNNLAQRHSFHNDHFKETIIEFAFGIDKRACAIFRCIGYHNHGSISLYAAVIKPDSYLHTGVAPQHFPGGFYISPHTPGVECFEGFYHECIEADIAEVDAELVVDAYEIDQLYRTGCNDIECLLGIIGNAYFFGHAIGRSAGQNAYGHFHIDGAFNHQFQCAIATHGNHAVGLVLIDGLFNLFGLAWIWKIEQMDIMS